MKKLLLEQFKREVKEASESDIKIVLKTVDYVESEVNSSNLEIMIYNIKNSFDSIIMDDEEYDTFISTRDELVNKYTNVETFKTGLLEFKNGLLNRNKISESSEESKINFSEISNESVQQESGKIITEDGPISEESIQLINDIKECIGSELFTEENFEERISNLHKSGLLGKLIIQNEEFKTHLLEGAGLENVTEDDILEFISTSIGLKLILKEITIDDMNYIIELINETDGEEVTESKIGFTDNVDIKENDTIEQANKSLAERIIEKCNQDADILSKELMEAEQMLRNVQMVNNMEVPKNVEIKEEIIKPVIDNKNKSIESKNRKICKHEGCTNVIYKSGYCKKHHKQSKKERKL